MAFVTIFVYAHGIKHSFKQGASLASLVTKMTCFSIESRRPQKTCNKFNGYSSKSINDGGEQFS